jgi:transcriptional regulator with XRE-family HTH domain
MKNIIVDNNILLENIEFFGRQFAPSTHITGKYSQRQVCSLLNINESNLSNWKRNTKPVARTTIIRMADKLSYYYNTHITPEMLVSRSLKDALDLTNFEPTLPVDFDGLDEKICYLLGKYPELKQPILTQLELYDKK